MVSIEIFTVHNTVSMIKSREWNTFNVSLEPLVDNGSENAEDSSNEDVGETINNLPGKQLISSANFLSCKERVSLSRTLQKIM